MTNLVFNPSSCSGTGTYLGGAFSFAVTATSFTQSGSNLAAVFDITTNTGGLGSLNIILEVWTGTVWQTGDGSNYSMGDTGSKTLTATTASTGLGSLVGRRARLRVTRDGTVISYIHAVPQDSTATRMIMANVGVAAPTVTTQDDATRMILANVGVAVSAKENEGLRFILANVTALDPFLINVWNGSAWVQKPMKIWDGSSWTNPRDVLYWTGSAWTLSPRS